MNKTTWNPYCYIEHFGSKEKLQEATGLYNLAFNKCFRSKTINSSIKAYLDNLAGFKEDPKFKKLPKMVLDGLSKYEMMEKLSCSNWKISKELKRQFGSSDTYKLRRELKVKYIKEIDESKIPENLLFAVKKFKTATAVGIYLGITRQSATKKIYKYFGTRNISDIRATFEK